MYQTIHYELTVDESWVLFCIIDDINRLFFKND
jgi:hypothetical protein